MKNDRTIIKPLGDCCVVHGIGIHILGVVLMNEKSKALYKHMISSNAETIQGCIEIFDGELLVALIAFCSNELMKRLHQQTKENLQ